MNRRIYLDYAATTPLDPDVRAAMEPFLTDSWGNASSVHQEGQRVRRAIDSARDAVAGSIGCHSSEVYFTSGGTESDNTALIGVLLSARERKRNHLITSTIEHHAVLDCAVFARDVLGFDVTFVSVDSDGTVSADAVAAAITDRTALVSIMHANNEIGTIQPIREIAEIAHAHGAYFHTDAVQTFGQMPISVDALGVDLMTLSAHKIYGPKGAGALYARKGTQWTPMLHGGQQEREKRAGTENAAAVIGFGRAVELLTEWRDTEAARLTALRDRFIADIRCRVPGAILSGHPVNRLPNNINLRFPGVDGETLLLNLDLHGIAASSGSACASGSIDPSHVLLALGLPLADARSAVRFSLGRGTTADDLEAAASLIGQCIRESER